MHSTRGMAVRGAVAVVSASRRLRVVAWLVLFALGAALFLYPVVSGWLAQRQAQDEIAQALAADGGESATAAAQSGHGAAAAKCEKAGDPAYAFLQAYNERVASGAAGAVNDPWGIGSDEGELADVGLADALVGSVSIPALGVELPLYLGASEAHMSLGATVIAGTSAPLGGAGQHCAIAAHRGPWRGLPMFRDIENVQVGDAVVIDTPWDTLAYRVVETRVIDPSDTAAVQPQPGRDLVSLLTCHPYGSNAQRYLVVCERVPGEGATAAGASNPAASASGVLQAAAQPFRDALAPTSSPLLAAERWLRVAGVALMAAVAVGALASAGKRAARRRNRAHGAHAAAERPRKTR